MLQEEILDEDDRAQQNRAIQKIKQARLRHGISFQSRSQSAAPAVSQALLAAAREPPTGATDATGNSQAVPADEGDIRGNIQQLQNKGIVPTIVRKYSRNVAQPATEEDNYVPPNYLESATRQRGHMRISSRRVEEKDEDDLEGTGCVHAIT